MSYLLDRKSKNKRNIRITLGIFVVLVLLFLGSGIFGVFSGVSHVVFRPVFILANSLGVDFSSASSLFQPKKNLLEENNRLKDELESISARLANYNSLLDENLKTREVLGRLEQTDNIVLSAILSKGGRSPYDTLIIDVGSNEGIVVGNLVLAYGSVAIGQVREVYARSAKVVLFSGWGEKTEAAIVGKDTFFQVLGRGGGSFEMVLPRDLELERGVEVVLPGISSRILATVETVISDPRDSFKKVVLVGPINIQELKFVQVQK